MKFNKLFSQDTNSNKLKDLLVFREKDRSYKLFNKYGISISENGFYKITVTGSDITPPIFYVLKYAVTWCTMEQRKKYKEIRRIEEIDKQLASQDFEIVLLQNKILSSVDPEAKSIYRAKYYEHKIKKRNLLKEIEEYVIDSKYWQNRKFKEADPEVLKQNDKYSDKDWK